MVYIRKEQIKMNKNLNPLGTNELEEHFLELLDYISVHFPHENIIILIDSIDQLANDELFLNSLIYSCPKNTKIIYSVLTNYKDIRISMQGLVKENRNFLELKKINHKTSIQILEDFLQV